MNLRISPYSTMEPY